MSLVLKDLSKSYGNIEVLRPVSLEIPKGEFLTILGPSGSGKTTILRLIGGFASPSAGQILLDGKDISRVPTSSRPFNTVFQDYALFPHMTVEDNVGYGLMVRGRPKSEIKRIVNEALEVVGLSEFPKRFPSELSGGQRQRVALARAIVCEPEVILLDEPLSALDAELRRNMQAFLKDLQRKIGTTFIFVTHDQEEAIALSDRMVVMNFGHVEQIGTPKEIYYAPQTSFVANFFGDNNLFDAKIDAAGRLETPFGQTDLPSRVQPGARNVKIAMRPELFSLGAREAALSIKCRVDNITFAGAASHLKLMACDGSENRLLVKLTSEPGANSFTSGSECTVSIATDNISIVEASS